MEVISPPAHQNAPPGTSEVAARHVSHSAASLRAKVREYLRGRGPYGATDEEMQAALRMDPNTQRPRRWELVNAGEVVDSNRRRKTHANRPAAVWVLKNDNEGTQP